MQTETRNPFVVGAALLAEAIGVPRDAGTMETRRAFRRAGYIAHNSDLYRVAAYRRGIEPDGDLYPLNLR